MQVDRLLHRLAENPPAGAKERVRAQMMKRIAEPSAFAALRHELTPPATAKTSVWTRVAGIITTPATGAFDAVRDALAPTPSAARSIREHVLSRLGAAPAPRFAGLKWVSAFAVFALLVRVSPLLFLAPHTEANSSVLLLPVDGAVQISESGLWQSIREEVTLSKETRLRTDDGEATVTLHSYGVVRLAPHTDIVLHDLTDHPGDAGQSATFTLNSGTVWVHGMVPSTLTGITIALPTSTVRLNEGSVSLTAADNDTVEVWSRRATVVESARETVLVSGESLTLGSSVLSLVRTMPMENEDEPWVASNLTLDAVHQREIAQLQLERRAAAAGIPPTSPLYPVKRIAEKVDVLFTFGSEARLEKELAHAETRLNEAAAIIAERAKDDEDTGSGVSLADYRRTLQIVASGSMVAATGTGTTADDAVIQSLLDEYKETVVSVNSGALASGTGAVASDIVEREVARNSVELASALPDNEAFLLKKAVLETTAAIAPETTPVNVEGQLIVDTLSALKESVDDGDIAEVQQTLVDLQPYLSSIEDKTTTMPPDVRKEADALLSSFATRVVARSEDQGDVDPSLLNSVQHYLPTTVQPTQRVSSLTEAQIDTIVDQIVERVELYELDRSRWSQLQQEFRRIDGHPDQGRILVRLYRKLPKGLTGYVRTEIHELRQARDEALEQNSDSSSSASSSDDIDALCGEDC